MNSTKKNSEFGGVKKKLTAAIAMLLVATIMMVSSTYAWFTLSTAPEVTGITTSVGANGNLEMALLNGVAKSGEGASEAEKAKNTYEDMSRITSAVGDSTAAGKSAMEANITWGNLVNVSDESYGLNNIKLNPARLHISNGAVSVAESILNTATYGADGRVNDLSGKTYTTANFVQSSKAFQYAGGDNQTYGVRAIGSNDSLSVQQAGLISAKAAYAQYIIEAKSAIVSAVQKNGDNLANAILAVATKNDAALTTEQQTAISELITAFETGASKLDLAYIEVMKAAASSLDKAAYEAVVGAVDDKTTAAEAKTAIEGLTGSGYTFPTELGTAIAALDALKASINNAKTPINGESPNYKAALNALVDISAESKIEINGFKLREPADKEEGDTNKYAMVQKGDGSGYTYNSDFLTSAIKGVKVTMGDGTGVFASFAQLANNYTIPTVVTVTIEYGGMTLNLKDTPFTLVTNASTTSYTAVTTAVNTVTAKGNTDTDTSFLSDTYGYVIDLAFRTNAAGSYLKLATDGIQRIYNGKTDASTNPATLGGGSTMTFQAAEGVTLTNEQIKALMGAIRVVFMNPADGTIYGVAALDSIDTDAEDSAALTGKLVLKKYSFETDGKIKLETAEDTTAKLIDLPQNTATKVSVVVYLDGDMVDNSMVANASSSITGSMNLQFASSETLVPMNYTPLKSGTATTNP